jgi:predicted DNA-binding antitoxin AbrB/MazE fold protein
LKLSEGEEFDIKLSTEIKEEVKEEPKKNEQAI